MNLQGLAEPPGDSYLQGAPRAQKRKGSHSFASFPDSTWDRVTGSQPASALRSGTQSVLLDLVEQAPVADIQVGRRSPSIPSGRFQGIVKQLYLCLAFYFVEHILHPSAREFRVRAVHITLLRWRRLGTCRFVAQILTRGFLILQDKRASHKVSQLTKISRPTIFLRRINQFCGERLGLGQFSRASFH